MTIHELINAPPATLSIRGHDLFLKRTPDPDADFLVVSWENSTHSVELVVSVDPCTEEADIWFRLLHHESFTLNTAPIGTQTEFETWLNENIKARLPELRRLHAEGAEVQNSRHQLLVWMETV